MRKTDGNGLLTRIPRTLVAACAAALLVAAPSSGALAQQRTDAPVKPAPAFTPAPPPAATAPAQQQPAPAPKPADPAMPAPILAPKPGPVPEPAPIVFRRVEMYGTMTSRLGKVATLLSLVVTSSKPIPVGAKGMLFRKVEKKGDLAATEWIEIGEVTLKNADKASKTQVTVENEKKDVLIAGKKSNHFAKGTKIKIQFDLPEPG